MSRVCYLLQLGAVLCADLQQLLFMSLNLLLKTDVLLSDDRLQHPQLQNKQTNPS